MYQIQEYLHKFDSQPCPKCGKICISYSQRRAALSLRIEISDICPECGTEIMIYHNRISNIIRLIVYINIFVLMSISFCISDLYFLTNLANCFIFLNIFFRNTIYIPFSIVEIKDEIKAICYKRKRYLRLILFIIAIVILFVLYYNNIYLELSKGFYA